MGTRGQTAGTGQGGPLKGQLSSKYFLRREPMCHTEPQQGSRIEDRERKGLKSGRKREINPKAV